MATEQELQKIDALRREAYKAGLYKKAARIAGVTPAAISVLRVYLLLYRYALGLLKN